MTLNTQDVEFGLWLKTLLFCHQDTLDPPSTRTDVSSLYKMILTTETEQDATALPDS